MLKNIPACISPELMKVMMQMGHGDELVITDADFPADFFGRKVIRADGVFSVDLLESILKFYPLDSFVKNPVIIMGPAENEGIQEFLKGSKNAIKKQVSYFEDFDFIDRYAFYDRASKAFAVVITSETDGNMILKKGVVCL